MDFMESLTVALQTIESYAWGWPLIIFFILSGLAITWVFKGVQFRYFFTTWRYVFKPEKSEESDTQISPLSALLTALSASLGNGSLAGMATAMVLGGPGAAFWIFVISFLLMPMRFAEVFASTLYTKQTEYGVRGGPMVYLSKVPGGAHLPSIFMFFCLIFSFVGGSGMQSNSMAVGIHGLTGISNYYIALMFVAFIIYIFMGGSQRIIKFSDTVAPLKVITFLIATVCVIVFFWSNLLHALKLIIDGAFTTTALAGGLVGHTFQNAMREGMSRATNASEAGLGTAGIFFGATKGINPFKAGVMSMATAFLTTTICCTMLLAFTASGTWNSGAESTQLVMNTYATVFGGFGSVIASMLSVLFGIGVLVGYGFMGRECWMYLTNGKWDKLFIVIYCATAFIGSIAKVNAVWAAVGIINAGLILCNMYGILLLLPAMKKSAEKYENA